MEATVASGPKGLKNHNYLRHVAWELAAELAARAETDREEARRRRGRDEDGPEPLSDTARQAIAALKKKWGVS